MKNLLSSYGGRRRYNEDFRTLQESASAINKFLTHFQGNFILSGCTNNEDGYVWIDDKIRYVNAGNKNTSYKYIIAKENNGTQIRYANDNEHEMNVSYGAEYSIQKPDDGIGYIELSNNLSRFKNVVDEYVISKNSDDDVVLNTEILFNNKLISSDLVLQDISCKTDTDSVSFKYGNYKYVFGISEPTILCYESDELIWVINKNDLTLGQITMQPLSGNNLTIKGTVQCNTVNYMNRNYQNVEINTNKITLPLYDEYDKADSTMMFVTQTERIVHVYGALNKYIYSYDKDAFDCHIEYTPYNNNIETNYRKLIATETYYIRHGTQAYNIESTYQLSGIYLCKTTLRLPDKISKPKYTPGTVLTGDLYDDDCNGISHPWSISIEMFIDTDGYINLIIPRDLGIYSTETIKLNANGKGVPTFGMYGETKNLGLLVNMTYLT